MFKKVSKPIAVIAALIIAITIIACSVFTTAFESAVRAATSTLNVATMTVAKNVVYGKKFSVKPADTGYTVTVKAPSGETATIDNGEVLATQVGIYEVTYQSTTLTYATYSYNVSCYMDYEYSLVIDGNGASIPTKWGKYDASDFAYYAKLPSATLYYYDEDEERNLPSGQKDDPNSVNVITCKVTDPSGVVTTYTKAQLDAGQDLKTDKAGVYFIDYSATMLGGENLLTKSFTVQVENKFIDSKAPTLSVQGTSSTASVNAKTTLPAATLSDDYDSRVNVEIKVQYDYDGDGTLEDVPEAVVNLETGYATGKYYKANASGDYDMSYNASTGMYTYEVTDNASEAVKATFDNETFMDFYPTQEGEYKVTYQAMDSTAKWGNPTTAAKNKTSVRSYNIKVTDTTAPVVDTIDESLIPTSWGTSVYKLDVNDDDNDGDYTDSIKVTNSNIQFPIPEIYDNKDSNDNLTIAFTLADPKSRTVMSFTNINATTATSSSSYGGTASFGSDSNTYYFFKYWDNEDTTYTVNETTGKMTGGDLGDNAYSLIYYDAAQSKVTKGFFNFDMWKSDSDYAGAYKVTYRIKDSTGNVNSNSYQITLADGAYTDTTRPDVYLDTPDYFVFRDYETTQSITDVSASDSEDTRLDVKYYALFNKSFTAASYLDDDNNLDFNKVFDPSNTDEYAENGDLVELDATLGTNTATLQKKNGVCELELQNKKGDDQTVTVDASKPVYIGICATDAVGNQKYYVTSVPVTDGTTAPSDVANYTPVYNNVNATAGVAGKQYLFGSFTINYASFADRANTGFELYVKRVQDVNGKSVDESPLSNVTFDTYSDNRETGTNTLHVDNVRFTPSKGGKYVVITRGFHISGASNVVMGTVDVTASSSGNITTSAILGDLLEYNTTYSLPNDYTAPDDGNAYGVVRTITGGRMQLMGNEFTAKQTTTYKFIDNVFKYETAYAATSSNGNTNTANNLIEYSYTDGSSATVSGNFNGDGYKYVGIASETTGNGGAYSSAMSDSKSPVIRYLGTKPTYSEVSTSTNKFYVTLPQVSASSENGNATNIACKVTDPDGNSVTVFDNEDVSNIDGYTGYQYSTSELTDGVPTAAKTLKNNQYQFLASKDGVYTVNYTASINGSTANSSFSLNVGDVVAPEFTVGIGTINSKFYATENNVPVTTPDATAGDKFDFAAITVTDEGSTTGYTYTKELISPENETVATVTGATKINNGSSFELSQAGTYKVVYTVADAVGNSSSVNYYITVTSSSSNVSSSAIVTLSIVLIIVVVVIIAGVIIYLVRFRKRKSI